MKNIDLNKSEVKKYIQVRLHYFIYLFNPVTHKIIVFYQTSIIYVRTLLYD